ncbi:MAG: GntR family transcriptional regulator [Gammaproteobacteria bacterium]|jgi:DNA-binding GntR family transcriptional regulator|nr:GntR family transcriptional regulator [Gammaproteobacteria bacterium]
MSQPAITLANRVCADIVQDIVTGVIPQGSKLNEPELARVHGISRGPLREAMSRLEAMRLIRRIPNVGASVVNLSYEELLEIYQIREALEGLAARLAAQHMSSQETMALRQLLNQHQQHIVQTEGQSYFQQEGDVDFHYRIVQGSNNQRLINILGGELYHLVRMYRYQFSLSSNRPEQALQEHNKICAAIEEGDAELAEWLMRRHISNARRNIKQRMQADVTPAIDN